MKLSFLCRLVVLVFACAYAAAIILFLVGQYGVADAERDPLSGVFLIPLGLPWNRFIDAAPEPAWPWLATLAPAVNLLLLRALCRLATRHGR